ncbi:MAG: superoxide dismutase, partial [Burkholderiales bacterium]
MTMAMTTLSSMAAIGPHVMPSLPYAEGALSPFISARTVGLHRDQHHQGYVDALNKAVVGTPFADLSLQQIIIATANQIEHAAIFNNAAQVWNH